MNRPHRWPAPRGGLIALVAAVLIGISTPLVQRFGVGVGSFSTAVLLYAGAALIGALLRRPTGVRPAFNAAMRPCSPR